MKNVQHLKTVLFVLLLSIFPQASQADTELKIFLLNTEFFWDDQEPHEGAIIGLKEKNDKPPTTEEYEAKATFIANKIKELDANFVGLIEVESEIIVEKVREKLNDPDGWHVIFSKGRDTYTGQDVALLSRFAPTTGSITTFPDDREVYFDEFEEEKSSNPSKILSAEIHVEDQPITVIIAHLISRRSAGNDSKRLAQANVIRRHAVKAEINGYNVIVMGDINDTPDTQVIKRLRGFDDIWSDMFPATAFVPEEERYTYIYQGQKNLLDHILVSASLRYELNRKKTCKMIDLGDITDHRGVFTILKFKSAE